MSSRFVSLALLGLLGACVDTTGGDLVTFAAVASGPADAVPGQPLDFVNDRGWHVSLTTASLHVGAVYLNQSAPVSGAQNTSCILPGTYVAQVTTGLDVDLLSPDQQGFPKPGTGVTIPAIAGQLWLTGGDVDTVADATPILHVVGTTDRNGSAFAFAGTVTIGTNRAVAGASGGNPICKQRIVSPIPTALEPRAGGKLLLTVDPRLFFANVDFTAPASGDYLFPDDSSDQPSRNLYQNLHSSAPYRFAWVP
jgi:hypothetical protein